MQSRDSIPVTRHESIGIVGLGNVGSYFAARLLRASRNLFVRDLDADKMDPLVESGAMAAGSSRVLAEVCDAVVLSLPDSEAVEVEVLGPGGVLAAGRGDCLIIDTSTIHPDTSRRLHAAAASRGFQYVEAPMSGGEPGGAGQAGARAGNVTFLVGGNSHAYEDARPVLDRLGRHVIHVGPIGAGNTVKLISNLIAGLNMAVIAEGIVLGAAAGISHEILLKAFRHTDAKSYTMFEEFAPHFCCGDYKGGFAVDLMHKDHRLARDLGLQYRVPLPFNQLALKVYQMCQDSGLGRESHAVVVELLAEQAGVRLPNRSR